MNRNILITGASGFIGSSLVEEAIKRKYTIFAGIRNTSSRHYLVHPNIHFLELDFSNDRSLDSAIQALSSAHGRINFVIHAAGISRAKNSADYYRVNLEHTKRFVFALQRNGQVPQKFILISSLSAFGPGHGRSRIHASQDKQPLTSYGKSKLQAEEFLYATKDFPFLVINPTTVYGPRDKDVLYLVRTIARHLEVYIGNSRQLLSFIHVLDLCKAIFLGMESSLLRQNLLVSDGKVYTAKYFNQVVRKHLDKRTIPVVLPLPLLRMLALLAEGYGNLRGKVPLLNRERLKEFAAPNWSVDNANLMELGYVPQFGLEEGLEQTIRWYKEQGWIMD